MLSRSEYPDGFPRSFCFDYLPESKVLILEYHLPDISCLPTLKELKYIATREQFQEVRVSDAWLNRTYDDVLYQITLRTIYELFQSDSVDALTAVVFNGWVNSIDKSVCPIVRSGGGAGWSVNLAAMDWLDFENLIREIFEKEFSQNGGEVKITQASRDGGVDARFCRNNGCGKT